MQSAIDIGQRWQLAKLGGSAQAAHGIRGDGVHQFEPRLKLTVCVRR